MFPRCPKTNRFREEIRLACEIDPELQMLTWLRAGGRAAVSSFAFDGSPIGKAFWKFIVDCFSLGLDCFSISLSLLERELLPAARFFAEKVNRFGVCILRFSVFDAHLSFDVFEGLPMIMLDSMELVFDESSQRNDLTGVWSSCRSSLIVLMSRHLKGDLMRFSFSFSNSGLRNGSFNRCFGGVWFICVGAMMSSSSDKWIAALFKQSGVEFRELGEFLGEDLSSDCSFSFSNWSAFSDVLLQRSDEYSLVNYLLVLREKQLPQRVFDCLQLAHSQVSLCLGFRKSISEIWKCLPLSYDRHFSCICVYGNCEIMSILSVWLTLSDRSLPSIASNIFWKELYNSRSLLGLMLLLNRHIIIIPIETAVDHMRSANGVPYYAYDSCNHRPDKREEEKYFKNWKRRK